MGTVGGRQCSHTIFEAWANGAWHLLDTDQMVFFLKRDNRTVASVADLARDPELMNRSHRNLGLAGKDLAGEGLLQRAVQKSGICVSCQSECSMDSERWPCATGHYGVAATPYDGDALAAGREAGALLGSGGQDGGAGASVASQMCGIPMASWSIDPICEIRWRWKGLEQHVNVGQETSGQLPAVHPVQAQHVSRMIWKIHSPYPIAGVRGGFVL